MYIQKIFYSIPSLYGDDKWHFIADPNNYKLATHSTANLNNQWVPADSSNSSDASIISAAGSGYYVVKSNSNYHVNSSSAIMYINFSFTEHNSFTFKIMNRAENNYDYPTISLSDGTVLYNNKSNTTSFANIVVDNPAGLTMTVSFSKGSSSYNDLDRAYLAIPDSITIQQ